LRVDCQQYTRIRTPIQSNTIYIVVTDVDEVLKRKGSLEDLEHDPYGMSDIVNHLLSEFAGIGSKGDSVHYTQGDNSLIKIAKSTEKVDTVVRKLYKQLAETLSTI